MPQYVRELTCTFRPGIRDGKSVRVRSRTCASSLLIVSCSVFRGEIPDPTWTSALQAENYSTLQRPHAFDFTQMLVNKDCCTQCWSGVGRVQNTGQLHDAMTAQPSRRVGRQQAGIQAWATSAPSLGRRPRMWSHASSAPAGASSRPDPSCPAASQRPGHPGTGPMWGSPRSA